MKYKILILTLICLQLSGCGFHFRQQLQVPAQLCTLNIPSGHQVFVRRLRHTLINQGVHVVNDSHAYTLHLPSIQQTTHLTTIGTSEQSRVYDINMRVTFSITLEDKVIVPPQTIQVTRQLTLDSGQLISTNNQAFVMQQTMEKDVIYRLLNRLNAPNIRAKLL